MLKKTIALICFSSILTVNTLYAKECCTDDVKSLRKDITTLTKKLDAIEAQVKNVSADLKKDAEKNKTEFSALRKELDTLKNLPGNTSNDFGKKIEEQQRKLDDLREIEEILVKYGNNPEGMSSLHYAIKMGDVNAVNLLLGYGADVNSTDVNFRPQTVFTALARAAACNQLEITQILLTLGADVNFSPYDDCYYPIYYAAKSGSSDLMTLLIESGAKLDRIKFWKDGLDGHPMGRIPETPLHTAAKAGNYAAVVALVNGGSDIDGRAPNPIPYGLSCEDTPLAWAALHLKYSDNPQNLELVKFLVSHGGTRRNVKYYDKNNIHNQDLCPVISGYLQSQGK